VSQGSLSASQSAGSQAANPSLTQQATGEALLLSRLLLLLLISVATML
jgi:hypothetical protein